MSKGQNKKTKSIAYGYEWIFDNFKFISFLAILGVVYISIVHSAEKHLREIQTLKKEVKELQWEYLTLKRDIVKGSSMSQLQAKMVEENIDLKGDFPTKIKAEAK